MPHVATVSNHIQNKKSCGINLKYKRGPTTAQKANFDFFSIPGFVVKTIPVEDQSMANLNARSCSSRRRRCLRKQDKKNMVAIRRYFQGGMHKKDTEFRWRSTILVKRKSCFTIASLLKDTTTQVHELNGYRTPNIGFFVCMLMGPRNIFDSDKNLPTH